MDKELERKIREEVEKYTEQHGIRDGFMVKFVFECELIDFAIKMIEKYSTDNKPHHP